MTPGLSQHFFDRSNILLTIQKSALKLTDLDPGVIKCNFSLYRPLNMFLIIIFLISIPVPVVRASVSPVPPGALQTIQLTHVQIATLTESNGVQQVTQGVSQVTTKETKDVSVLEIKAEPGEDVPAKTNQSAEGSNRKQTHPMNEFTSVMKNTAKG